MRQVGELEIGGDDTARAANRGGAFAFKPGLVAGHVERLAIIFEDRLAGAHLGVVIVPLDLRQDGVPAFLGRPEVPGDHGDAARHLTHQHDAGYGARSLCIEAGDLAAELRAARDQRHQRAGRVIVHRILGGAVDLRRGVGARRNARRGRLLADQFER